VILHFHEAARQEFLDSVDFYAEESQQTPERFIAEVEKALDEISLFPNRYPLYRRKYRRKVLKKHPFSIFYSIKGNEITIDGIYHNLRAPDSWIGRK
jgi:toxin ParE1/3/4